MAAVSPSGIAVLGTAALPIALGATGGASDVWTLNHNKGASPLFVIVTVSGAIQPNASITVTNPTVNQLVLTNTTAGALNVVAYAFWELPSASVIAAIAAAAGTLS